MEIQLVSSNTAILTSNETSTTATMTSQEIADVVDSRHDTVKNSIERLAERGVIKLPTDCNVLNHKGQSVKMYTLSKRCSFIVAAQLSPESIGDVIDAWGKTSESLQELLSALNAFDVPSDVVGMYVYAIQDTETKRVKLGISRDPERRLMQLQTGSSSKLELLAYKRAFNGFGDESEMHSKASEYHVRGEWFSPEAVKYIN